MQWDSINTEISRFSLVKELFKTKAYSLRYARFEYYIRYTHTLSDFNRSMFAEKFSGPDANTESESELGSGSRISSLLSRERILWNEAVIAAL